MFNPGLFAQLESGAGYNKTYENSVLNPFVNFHQHANTQSLSDVLVAESIQMRGVECYYIRREFVNLDHIFGEDPDSKFEKAYKIAIYLQSFEGFEGQQDFFSKFGMQVNDELTFQVNPGLFKHQADGALPKEGDLIYFPMGNTLFELVWVEANKPFFQVGESPIMTMTASKFIYSGEDLGNVKVKSGPGQVPDPEFGIDHGLDLDELTTFSDVPNFIDDDELMPVKNLNGLGDIKKRQYEEDNQIDREGKEFIDPITFDPINGSGIIHHPSPFDNFMES